MINYLVSKLSYTILLYLPDLFLGLIKALY